MRLQHREGPQGELIAESPDARHGQPSYPDPGGLVICVYVRLHLPLLAFPCVPLFYAVATDVCYCCAVTLFAAAAAADGASALRQLCDTTFGGSWLGEETLEEVLDGLINEADYEVPLRDFVGTAETLCVVFRCINLLYRYSDIQQQQQHK